MSTPVQRPRGPRPQAVLEVLRTQRLTPGMVRVELGGPGVADLSHNESTDRYVKLLIPAPGSGLEPPFDLEVLREQSPELLPSRRTYTVRRWDTETGTLTLDFVVHGEGDGDGEGVAAPWALGARPGDRIAMSGAGGGYTPAEGTAYHLLVGDHSALPAIAAALESMREDATGRALIQVDRAEDQVELAHPAGVAVEWLVGAREQLLTRLRSLELPTEGLQVFAHGERGVIKEVRRDLVTVRGIPKEQISISAYWALGRVEDQFQAEKREPVGRIEED